MIRGVRVELGRSTPFGELKLILEVDERGEPWVIVGRRNRGRALVLTRRALDVWRRGNVAATFPPSRRG